MARRPVVVTVRRGTARAFAASIAAMLPLGTVASPGIAAPAPHAPAFTPPVSPLILTRELRRPLADGKEIVARRRYAVTFTPVDGGYRVDGTLIDVAVEAPPALAALARLERQRTDAVFPIHLDRHGLIADSQVPAARAASNAAVTRAASEATTRILAAHLPSPERHAGTAFVQELTTHRTALTAWPKDLFRPQASRQRETSRVALPGGGTGTVTVTVEAQLSAGSAPFDAVWRTVVTEFAGTRRSTMETWRLDPPGGTD